MKSSCLVELTNKTEQTTSIPYLFVFILSYPSSAAFFLECEFFGQFIKISATFEIKLLVVKGTVPSPRSGTHAVSISSKFAILYGGYTMKGGEYFNDLYIFYNDQKTCQCIESAVLSPIPRIDASFVKTPTGSGVIFFGGTDGREKFDDLWLFDAENLQWKMLSPETIGPSPRFGHVASAFGSSLYVFGGWDGSNTLNDFWEYNITKNCWYCIDQNSGVPSRYRHSAVVWNNKMFIFGGVDKTQQRFSDLYGYCFFTKKWKRIVYKNQGGPTARSFHRTAMMPNGKMVLVGGFDGERNNDCFTLDLSSKQIDGLFPSYSSKEIETRRSLISKENGERKSLQNYIGRWAQLSSKKSAPPKLNQFSCVVIGNILYVFGGSNEKNQPQNALITLDLANYEWKILKPKGKPPEARNGASLQVYDKTKIVVFGGWAEKESKILTSLFVLDTVTLTWMDIKLDQKYIPKLSHYSMVISGKSLFIFGGKTEAGVITDNLFCVDMQSMAIHPTIGLGFRPCRRMGHSAAAHGLFMYIFGGWDGTKCLNDFYEYSFDSNIWYDLRRSAGERPLPRYYAAVETFENHFVVSGGVSEKNEV